MKRTYIKNIWLMNFSTLLMRFSFYRKEIFLYKRTLSDSIGASLKTYYACDDNMNLTEEGIYNAISWEIRDELNIETDSTNLRNSIFAFYRDLVEGGKPQFLFYYKDNTITTQSFEEKFRERYGKKEKNNTKIDGNKFYFYSLEQLRNAEIYPGKLIVNDGNMKIKHTMMPSASAAIVMLLKYKSRE